MVVHLSEGEVIQGFQRHFIIYIVTFSKARATRRIATSTLMDLTTPEVPTVLKFVCCTCSERRWSFARRNHPQGTICSWLWSVILPQGSYCMSYASELDGLRKCCLDLSPKP